MIRPSYDGWVDQKAAREVRDGDEALSQSEEEALRSLAQFRGEVLAAAYLLEASLDRLIIWQLFRDRQDGMAGFFEDLVLRENGFGLERKVRLVRAIIDYWKHEEADAAGDKHRLDRARHIRNQVAHWPARLVPILRSGSVIGFEAELVKGGEVTALDVLARRQILDGFEQATERLEGLSAELAEFARNRDG